MISIIKSKAHSLLMEAIKADNAIKGTLQRYRQEKNDLIIIASAGFSKDFLDHFKSVKAFDASCCGRAFGTGTPIMINDIEKDISFRPHLEVARREGFRSVISVPILSSAGKVAGVLATHFKEPKEIWDTNKLNKILPELREILEEDLN